MLEITRGEMANGTLKEANELYGLFPDSEFVYLELYLAFGDISNLDSQASRDIIDMSVDVKSQIDNLLNLVKSHDKIRIWTSKNTIEDYLNMLFAVHLITNNYPEKKIILVDYLKVLIGDKYPDTPAWSLDVLESDRIEKLLKFEELINSKQINELCSEWDALIKANSTLRISDNGRIDSVDESFFDELMLRVLKDLGESGKSRLIGTSMAETEHSDGNLSNLFYAYRLERLIEAGKIKVIKIKDPIYHSIVALA